MKGDNLRKVLHLIDNLSMYFIYHKWNDLRAPAGERNIIYNYLGNIVV